jgi:hypothetical protein
MGFSNNSYSSGGSSGGVQPVLADEAMVYQGMTVQALPAQGMTL